MSKVSELSAKFSRIHVPIETAPEEQVTRRTIPESPKSSRESNHEVGPPEITVAEAYFVDEYENVVVNQTGKNPSTYTADNYTDPGVFLVGWTDGQVAELSKWIRYFACIEPGFDKSNGLMSFKGDLRNWERLRRKHGVLCSPLVDIWTDALKATKPTYPKHAVVFGCQEDDDDKIMMGYAITGGDTPVMVVDMVDVHSINFSQVGGGMSRLEQSFNLFWVMTHELFGHFYLKLDHGEKGGFYKNGRIESYSYNKDETIRKMNDWRMDLGLPTRLQHPANVSGRTREYIYIDYAPESQSFVGNSPNIMPKPQRKKLELDLRTPIQNMANGSSSPSTLVLPENLANNRHYAIASFTDDDSDKTELSADVTVTQRYRKAGLQGLRLKMGRCDFCF
eukprot:m.849 g.849  ORF g.849 m.849 type:complete len:393 (-) comp431_c0_seq1:509-1687(-)